MFKPRTEQPNDKGKTSYNRSVVFSIVDLATKEIEGAENCADSKKSIRRNRIDFVGNDVYVEVFINVLNGYGVSDVAYKIQENIKCGVETMTGTDFIVKEVNVNVVGVVFET